MKTLAGSARNLIGVFPSDEPDNLIPGVEAILMLSETNYAKDSEGNLLSFPVLDTVRVVMSPDGLRNLAETFREWANEAEERFSAAPQGAV